MIIKNIEKIQERIANACKKVRRNPSEVKLLLATKMVSSEDIKIALNYGQTLIGENKIQEVIQKYEDLKEVPHTSHFIGHLQTNKVKYAIKYGISCIQSVDNWDLVLELNKRLSKEEKTMDILIQVNTSFEESKFGLVPKSTLEFVKKVSDFKTIKIKGLMTIGALSNDNEKVRDCFKRLKNLQQEIKNLNLNIDIEELSMGMSGDLETAIEEGSTIIRIGSAIFGSRY